MPYPHTYIKLTDEERKKINQELQVMAMRKQFRKRRRLQSISLSDSGFNYDEISHRLDVSYWAVQLWISTYRKLGLDKFLASMR